MCRTTRIVWRHSGTSSWSVSSPKQDPYHIRTHFTTRRPCLEDLLRKPDFSGRSYGTFWLRSTRWVWDHYASQKRDRHGYDIRNDIHNRHLIPDALAKTKETWIRSLSVSANCFYVFEKIYPDLWRNVLQEPSANEQIVAHAKLLHPSEEAKNRLQSSVRQLFKENNDNLHSYTHKQMLLLFVTRDSGQRDYPHHPTSLHLLKTTGNRCMETHSSRPALPRKWSLLVLCIFSTRTGALVFFFYCLRLNSSETTILSSKHSHHEEPKKILTHNMKNTFLISLNFSITRYNSEVKNSNTAVEINFPLFRITYEHFFNMNEIWIV